VARPKKTNPVTAGGGAALGAILGGPLGAIVGAGLGALAGEETPSLEEALRGAFRDRGLELVSVRSTSRSSVVILFRGSGAYRTINVQVAPGTQNVDDALYDRALSELNRTEEGNAGYP